ncbi:hypothetical protein RHMOL_Rhmol12G0216500 [Rhododendron molle]|uniref:Uncharacterized protein n=1 Tax=Rhododendron molle TaxID=49168 RepID=A0ACC0LLZ3_RHOML|nr:hypothetical protein RHMOL_Rhmol12G0216500 [Rhododendron molle]
MGNVHKAPVRERVLQEQHVLDHSDYPIFLEQGSNQNAKILHKVDYPVELDVYDLCSYDLRKKLEAPRKILRYEKRKKLHLKINEEKTHWTRGRALLAQKNEKSIGSIDNDVKMNDAKGSSNVSGESSNATSKEGVVPDKEMHLTGIYDLVAVLTHKGRSADSRHYVAWVKQ